MREVNARTNVDACVLKGAEHDRNENHRKCLTDTVFWSIFPYWIFELHSLKIGLISPNSWKDPKISARAAHMQIVFLVTGIPIPSWNDSCGVECKMRDV